MDNLVEVSDQEVKINFELNTKCRATVNLRSLIAGVPVAYKVQTSSPHKFLVNSPSGIIASPLYNTTFQIILKPQSQLPPTFPRSSSDRFLIRAAVAPELAHYTAPDSVSVNSWFSSRPHQATHDVKLRVAFIGPLLLRHAVAAGDIDSVKSLLRRQRALASEIPPTEAESILKVAISSSDAHMIGLLVEAGFRTGATVTVENRRCEGEALLEAARVGDVDKVKRLMQKDEVMRFRDDQYGMTALHVAAIKGRADVVALLLECGRGGVEWRDAEGHTPLHLAVEGGNVDTVGILVGAGANVNDVSDRGATPLYMARAMGYEDVEQLLLDMGASTEQNVVS